MPRLSSAMLSLSRLSPARLSTVSLLTVILAITLTSTASFAASPDRIGTIGSPAVKLTSGVPAQAKQKFDVGPVSPSLSLDYITLLTVPSANQKKALTKLLADQQNPHSTSYHKWLTPEQYADQFGLSPNDINKLTAWLKSQGFTVVRTARGRNWIAFSGTAAQVQRAFQVQIDNFKVDGEMHFANTTPAVIPSALSGVVTGFRGLHNFLPKSQAKHADPGYTLSDNGGKYYFLAPGDIAAMYDVSGLYGAGFDGTGETLAVMGQTGIYQSDLTDFRSGFGLSAISCTTSSDVITACNTSNFKYVLVNGSATSVSNNDLPEADLDLEWSGATARKAQIIYVVATSGFGVWDSWYYAVDNTVSPVITMSYTAPCELAEAEDGNSGETTFNSDEAELSQANSEGITFLNSSGDTGAAECDYGNSTATYGYATAYPASSQYVTGVGGTSIPNISPNEYTSTYWNSGNGTDGGSATGYIPEQAWNDSEEFGLICEANPTDSRCSSNGTITNWQTAQAVLGLSAGGGGISNCVTINANTDECLSGFSRPSWQSGINITAIDPSGFGVTTTPARYSPDVSLLASPDFPGYVVCTAKAALHQSGSGSICASGISTMLAACVGGTGPCGVFGGTSVSTPVFAGMVVLMNQYLVTKEAISAPGLGNINPTLYQLAAATTNGAFNQVTTGLTGTYSNGSYCNNDNDSNQISALQCPGSGFLGFSAYESDPTTGYNLVTGLGSVNANHLASAWLNSLLSPTTTTIAASPTSAYAGVTVTLTATVTPSTATGTVSFYNNGSSTAFGTATLSSGVATLQTTTLPVGSDSISATYGGDSADAASSTTTSASVTIQTPTFNLSTPTIPSPAPAGESTTSTFTISPTSGGNKFTSTVTFSCSGLPDATVSCAFSPTQINAGASATQVTVTISTSGPNTGANIIRRRADNRTPWLPLSLPLAGVMLAGFAGRKLKVTKHASTVGLCIGLLALGLCLACGGGSTPPVEVTVSGGAAVYPSYANWPAGTPQTTQFTASVANSTNTAVNWSVSTANGGTISSSGLYTAPAIALGLPSRATITATSQASAAATGSATETITPTTVPTMVVGEAYSIQVIATEAVTQVTSSTISLTVK